MLYPVAIETGDTDTAYGAVVPDLEGCFSAGDSFEEALLNVKDAIEAHLELLAEDGVLPPAPSKLDERVRDPEFTGWVWALVDVDVDPFLGKSAKVNVTLPNLITKKIDDAVEAHGEYKSRSHFLQLAAIKELNVH